MQTVPRGAGGAIPRPLLHPAGRHPGNAASGRCLEPRPRSPFPAPGSASRAPPTRPGRCGAPRLELHERKVGSTRFVSMVAKRNLVARRDASDPKEKSMRTLASFLAVAALFTTLGSRLALAQSSGNF